MFFSLKGTSAISLKRQGVVGYLIATASDVMAIKLGLQFSPKVNGIIGLSDPPVMLPEKVRELLAKSDTETSIYLKTCKFNTQALEVHLSSMDDQVSRPVAVFYGGSQSGWQVVQEFHKSLSVIDVCEACHLEKRIDECSYRCQDCWSSRLKSL